MISLVSLDFVNQVGAFRNFVIDLKPSKQCYHPYSGELLLSQFSL